MSDTKQEVRVICFAGLRKYFNPELAVMMNFPSSYADLLDHLGNINPEAMPVLKNCRIAVDETFVPGTSPIDATKAVFLIPPSSGG